MSLYIRAIQPTDAPVWNEYVDAHPQATLYHLYGWRNVIEKTYGHKTYYLAATKGTPQQLPNTQYPIPSIHHPASTIQHPGTRNQHPALVGILPLVHLKHFLFGNSLISMPFFDLGGILADDEETEQALLLEAIRLGHDLKANTIELRQAQPLTCFNKINQQPFLNPINSTNSTDPINPIGSLTIVTKSHKVRMLLDLPDSPEILMKSFKSKLRSQIRKPIKEGLSTKIANLVLLEDFYKVFSINMRDLGSPVHSKKLIRNVLEEFPEKTKIVMVYKNAQPIACSLIIDFKGALENPWASALRKYSNFSPNMLLYWSMLEYACQNDLIQFDFGRSTPGEGAYKFKEQWGAKPTAFHWLYVSLNGHQINEKTSEKSTFESAIKYWQRLPVPITRMIGPMIRKHIGL